MFHWAIIGSAPPKDLLSGEDDEEISSAVIEYPYYQKLAGKLRKVIHECYDIWGKMKQSTEEGEKDQTEAEKEVKFQAGKIQQNILKKKLILCDLSTDPHYTHEHTIDDTVEYAKNQMDEAENSEALNELAK
ncbi:hypothetical protein PoHVEF18_005245 [Penicillium ochrochloron]